MPTAQNADERLRQIYQLLRETLEPSSNGDETDETRWHAPPLPLDLDGRTSATDLLSWWFRPPSGEESSWNRYFGDAKGSSARAIPKPTEAVTTETAIADPELDIHSRAALRALVDWPTDELSNDDAEVAIEVFYGFLRALGRNDITEAMLHVAEDYHVFEDDREVDRGDLRCSLEVLLDSMQGYEFDVTLATVPEPLGHPYGIVMYAEIQIDAIRAQDGAKRNIVERRLVLLQWQQADSTFKIAAFSKPRS